MKYILATLITLFCVSCEPPANYSPQSSSGVNKANVNVKTQSNGLTIEQANIAKRIELENQPGSVKHLYIISAYSGEVILYSTVKGKVTSSGKRLTPSTVTSNNLMNHNSSFSISFPGYTWPFATNEVLQDDGTYGSSAEYLYWFDASDVYHQQYVTGGMILHVSTQPMQFGRVTQKVQVQK